MHVHKPGNHPMPEIAVFVAEMKAAFGEREIDEAIRLGKAEEPTFHACENGHPVGTTTPAATNVWRADRALRNRHHCNGCDGSCIGTTQSCVA
ncbi:hypothetical protein B0G76_3428 [Paraburkholderia sp. BL23I1N1]|uniref:hypothetical protein n=1 Tax=Paraburkholderia sp. BL23I1N1 TaxID=1938802 RepID=UPI000E7201D1|nr:hypothetical protein [Paraburkholderia sp. BL23I1N1]RKE37191.1 hypothetical protein B0G76_3428 [Paraburkholderia sp. BL23I1N1]